MRERRRKRAAKIGRISLLINVEFPALVVVTFSAQQVVGSTQRLVGITGKRARGPVEQAKHIGLPVAASLSVPHEITDLGPDLGARVQVRWVAGRTVDERLQA